MESRRPCFSRVYLIRWPVSSLCAKMPRMNTNPQNIQEVAVLLPLLIGALATIGTIIIHGAAGRGMTLVVSRVLHRDWTGAGFISDASTIAGAAMLLLAAHVLEIAVWAVVLKGCGEFRHFGLACYHSAMNYTTLGYGDIVMSPRWRFMGPMEALNGMLLVGLSTAVLFSVVQQVARRSMPQLSRDVFGL
jgi:hypothetical protein